MAQVKVYNIKAQEVGSIDLDDEIFAVEYNEPVIHEAIVAQNANSRQGTKCTLTRSEVRGHAKKPHKQKHTGSARQGSTKAPHQTGGGVAFAPKPRDFSKKVNKQTKRLAFVSALSAKLAQNELTVIDEFNLENPKTKEVASFVKAFKFPKSVVIVLADNDQKAISAAANIPNVSVTTAQTLNTYEIVSNKNVVLTKSAIKSIEEDRV